MLGLVLATILAAAPSPEVPWEVEPLLVGEKAPFSGLLLTEERFRLYIDQQRRAEAAEAKIKTRDLQLEQLLLPQPSAPCSGNPTLWERADFYVGVGLGVLLTGSVVWAGVVVADAVRTP